MTKYDAIVIGAGHNGLITSNYLAKAGKKVLVVDARHQPGGCASTKDFANGFQLSDCAQWVHQFDDKIVNDLSLEQHGFVMGESKRTIALQAGGDHLTIDGDNLSGAGISASDQKAFKVFRSQMHAFAKLMLKLYRTRAPKMVEANWADRITLLSLGLGLKMMGRRNMQDMMRLVLINIYDVMNEHFDHDGLKAAIALDAITGTNMGPRSPNTVFTYIHRMVGEALGNRGVSQVMGGMGRLGDALLSSAQAQGVEVRLGETVSRIVKIDDRVTGVELSSGDILEASAVVSSADPKTTYRDLLGYRHIEAGQARRVEQYRTRSGTGKLHLALSDLPSFTGVSAEDHSQRLIIAPSMDAMETGLNPIKYKELTSQHVFDISIPSIEDPAIAPAGQHMLTALVHYVPYELKTGWDGNNSNGGAESAREQLLESLLQQLEAYAPGIRDLIIASEVVVPEDFEASHGMTGGNWHHGELSIDQALMMRPFPGSTQYTGSVEGLYLCGAGSHPGGSLMGLAGKNAAEEILKQGVLS